MIRSLLFAVMLASMFGCQSKQKGQNDTPVQAGKDTITLVATGMTCTGCEGTVQGAIEKVPGVSKAQASHVTGEVTIICNKAATDTSMIRNAVLQAGYGFTDIKQ